MSVPVLRSPGPAKPVGWVEDWLKRYGGTLAVDDVERLPEDRQVALFNAFMNSKQNGGSDYPIVASATGPGRAGATVRQSIIGLDFRGPETVCEWNQYYMPLMPLYWCPPPRS